MNRLSLQVYGAPAVAMTRHEHASAGEPPGRAFVGRNSELAELTTALDHALAGHGRLVLLVGEPGIGKTRLAGELAVLARGRGMQVLWGRCWEGEGAPAYWPWVQIIRAAVEAREPEQFRAEMGPGAADIAQVFPTVRERLPDVVDPPPLEGEQARFRLFDSITTFVKRATRAAPLAFVLEDLHWADKDSLLLLRFLAREMAECRLIVVGTYRDVEVQRGNPLAEILPALRREPVHERLLLRGLAEPDVRALLVARGGAEVPEALARAIFRETEGNPFFIGEILQHLVEEGVISRERGRWTSRVAPEQIRVPESVRDVIGRRLNHLSTECNQALTTASVIGREFGTDALERVSDIPAGQLSALLDEALDAQVVHEVPRALGRYSFAHTLIRETLYEELRTVERVRRHRRVAEVLEELYARNPEPHVAELAHHFLEALPGGDLTKAADYATRAGDRACGQLAYEDAALHYERALQALELQEPADERLRCELLLKLGEARWSVGGFEPATKALEEAAMLAERLGDPDLFARAALRLGGPAFFSPGEWTRIPFFERALTALGDGDSALRAQLMARLAGVRTYAGDPAGTGPLARAAVEMARRVGDHRALASVLSSACRPLEDPDDVEERLALADELIRLADEAGDERRAVEAHTWKHWVYLELGDVVSADREMESKQRRAEVSRDAVCRWAAVLDQSGRAVLEGRLDEGEQLIQRALEIASDVQLSPPVMALQGARNLLFEQQGRDHELLPSIVSLAAAFPKSFLWRVSVAHTRVAVGETEAARRDLESLAVNDFRDLPRTGLWLYPLCRLSEVVSFFGDAERARPLYDLLLPYADRCSVPAITACRGSVSRSLGLLATVLGRHDEAEHHFECALEMNARIRARIWVAHTQHDYARMLVARDRPGDRERAAVLAAQAIVTAREVGMKPLEAKLVELRAAAGLGEPDRPDEVSIEDAGEARTTAPMAAEFRREGDVWTIAYEGQRIRLKDSKGLHYIAELLRHEGRELHAIDLAASGEADAAREPTRSGAETATVAAGLGDAGEVLDASARAAYRQRLADLEAELAEATEWADSGHAAKLSEEIELLRAELAAAFGLGGRARKAGDVADRARKAVTSRVRETIARITTEHPALGRHLENAIRTGLFCSYQPDRSPDWRL